MIRENGGEMKETYGVPVEEIQEGIRHGVRKVNIDTDIRLAMTAAIRKFLHENPSKFDPRDYLKPATAAAKAICVARYQQFGCAGRRRKIKPRATAENGRPLQERRAAPDRELVARAPARGPRAWGSTGNCKSWRPTARFTSSTVMSRGGPSPGRDHRDDGRRHGSGREPAERLQRVA